MAEIKVNVPEEAEKKFRKTAKIIYGEDKSAEDKAATEALAKWSVEREESLTGARTRQKLTHEGAEHGVDPSEPIFTHLTMSPKTGKKGRVSVDHDKYLYR